MSDREYSPDFTYKFSIFQNPEELEGNFAVYYFTAYFIFIFLFFTKNHKRNLQSL